MEDPLIRTAGTQADQPCILLIPGYKVVISPFQQILMCLVFRLVGAHIMGSPIVTSDYWSTFGELRPGGVYFNGTLEKEK